MTPVRKSVEKLRKLKEIRRKNLEKNFLEIQMKGQDHYVFIKENGKALSLIHISEPTRP